MTDAVRESHDLTAIARDSGPHPNHRVSKMASGLMGSEILRIAGEIRALVADGRPVCDLTVGDFNPRHFPIPARLSEAVCAAIEAGETNYPPAPGMPALREAVRRWYARDLGLDYPLESVLVAGGSRPLIYGVYRTLCDPGDRVVYPVPSWNNNHYAHMVGAVGTPVFCTPETRFMPTEQAVRAQLSGARLLALNSPLNPAGTAITPKTLEGICEAVLEENAGRDRRGERPLFVMYDQVYWMLCFGSTTHVTPPGLLPEMARYTVIVDGVSKAFAATGLRVGWAAGPVDVMSRMSAVLGHVGAWAPRAEQVATAALLSDAEAIASYEVDFKRHVQSRLDLLHEGIQTLRREGLPVDSIPPMGAIYLTTRIHPFGKRTPRGTFLETNEQVRRYLLETAGIGIVPFQAFGSIDEDGWFRLSVGAVGEVDISEALPRLAGALESLA